MPNAIDLTDAATAAQVLGVPAADPHLPRLITAASSAVAAYVGYPLHKRTETEAVAGTGSPFLFLKAGAVRSISSITVHGQVLAPADYALDSALMGRIVGRRPVFPFTGTATGGISPNPLVTHDTGAIRVSFEAGFVTPGLRALDASLSVDLPPEVEQAALEVVTAWHRQKGRDARVTSLSLGDGSLSYGEMAALPMSARQLLAPFRKPTRRTF